MDRTELERELTEAFEGDDATLRVVSRQARDLADSGKYEADQGADLTVDVVVSNLSDAPDDAPLAERWNWWIGSLDIAHGGYEPFRVQPWALE
ncbi:MAG: hypothetical protein ABEJ23_09580 [Haloarculaceae archaeon]